MLVRHIYFLHTCRQFAYEQDDIFGCVLKLTVTNKHYQFDFKVNDRQKMNIKGWY